MNGCPAGRPARRRVVVRAVHHGMLALRQWQTRALAAAIPSAVNRSNTSRICARGSDGCRISGTGRRHDATGRQRLHAGGAVPAAAIETWPPAERQTLAHELMHIRRNDLALGGYLRCVDCFSFIRSHAAAHVRRGARSRLRRANRSITRHTSRRWARCSFASACLPARRWPRSAPRRKPSTP